MSTSVSYGSITITDITDIGELSVYPTSNLPLSVIYSPDQNSYTPNWANNNLVLTPTIYYAGASLNAGSSGVSVTWKRQEGISGETDLTTGETVSGGVLTVAQNKFTSTSTMITYIVTVTYIEPDSNKPLTAKGQITFNLIKQPSTVKDCTITGDTIFKYNTSQQLVGSGSIVLTATCTGSNNGSPISVTGWKYKSADDPETWTTYPNSSSSSTLTVNATDNVFTNDRVTIKVITSDNTVYDLHTIVKLRDGVAGKSTVAAVLSNEDQMIACNSTGAPVSGAFADAKSQIIIYRGGTVETSSWAINIAPSNANNVKYEKSVDGTTYVSSSASGTNYSYVRVTELNSDTGSITFTCTKSGETQIVKTFSLIKMKVGADGKDAVVYSLDCSALAVNKAANESTFSPSTVTVYAYKKTGGADRTAYAGRFKVLYGSETDTSTANETSHEINSTMLSGGVANGYITVELYEAGGTTKKLDSQTIVITTDGRKGDQGDKGEDGEGAINIVLGNQADVIPCTYENKTAIALTINIPFDCFKGTERVAGTVATPAKLFGTVNATVTPATTTASGSIVYSVNSGTAVSAASGTISLTFSCEGQSIIQEYRWTRSTAATNGQNAVILQLSTPQGNVFVNQEGSLTIVGALTDGAVDKTTSVTSWVWAKYTNGSYSNIAGATTKTLTVQGSTVDGYASFRCTATYNGKSYIQYYSLIDKSDPIQVEVFSSFGNQIINKQGVGVLYVRVFRSGEEIDELKSDRFLTANPSGAAKDDYYYKINSSDKSVTLMKFNGTSWGTVADEGYTGTYEWNYRDKDGNPQTTGTPASSGKVIYIDGSYITKKIIADVTVTI